MHPRPAAAFADEADGPWISVGSTRDGTFAKLNHHELPTAPPATPPAVCITQEGGDVLWIPPGWLHSVDTIQEGPLTDLSSVRIASVRQRQQPDEAAAADCHRRPAAHGAALIHAHAARRCQGQRRGAACAGWRVGRVGAENSGRLLVYVCTTGERAGLAFRRGAAETLLHVPPGCAVYATNKSSASHSEVIRFGSGGAWMQSARSPLQA